MRLYIAEKPSVGRALAACLPDPHRKGQGWIETGDGVVTGSSVMSCGRRSRRNTIQN